MGLSKVFLFAVVVATIAATLVDGSHIREESQGGMGRKTGLNHIGSGRPQNIARSGDGSYTGEISRGGIGASGSYGSTSGRTQGSIGRESGTSGGLGASRRGQSY